MNAKLALEPFFSISALRWGLLLSSPVGIQSRLLSKGLAFVSVGFLQRITAIQHPLVFKHGLMVVTVSFLFFSWKLSHFHINWNREQRWAAKPHQRLNTTVGLAWAYNSCVTEGLVLILWLTFLSVNFHICFQGKTESRGEQQSSVRDSQHKVLLSMS